MVSALGVESSASGNRGQREHTDQGYQWKPYFLKIYLVSTYAALTLFQTSIYIFSKITQLILMTTLCEIYYYYYYYPNFTHEETEEQKG